MVCGRGHLVALLRQSVQDAGRLQRQGQAAAGFQQHPGQLAVELLHRQVLHLVAELFDTYIQPEAHPLGRATAIHFS